MNNTIENIKQNYKEDIENWINGKKVYLSSLSLAFFSNEEIAVNVNIKMYKKWKITLYKKRNKVKLEIFSSFLLS